MKRPTTAVKCMARRSKSPSRRAGTPISERSHATAAPRPPRAPPRRTRALRPSALPLLLSGARPRARSISLDAARVPAGRHLELLRKNPQGVGIVVALALMIALAPRRPRLATAVATINMAHTFPFLSNHAALWITALAAGTDSAVCRALLGVGYLAAGTHKLNPDFMHPVTGCMADAVGCAARGRVWAADGRRRGGGVRRARLPAVCRAGAVWRPRNPAAPQSRRAASLRRAPRADGAHRLLRLWQRRAGGAVARPALV